MTSVTTSPPIITVSSLTIKRMEGQYNRAFMETNKIATVFNRDDFSAYIQREIRNGNLVRIKNKSTQASERAAVIADGYSKNAFIDSNIPQNDTGVN